MVDICDITRVEDILLSGVGDEKESQSSLRPFKASLLDVVSISMIFARQDTVGKRLSA